MVKYLDFIGLSLYNDLTKKYIDNKDITNQIINEQLSGKDTLVIVPGAYNPSTGTATQTTIKVNIDNDTIKFKNVAGTYSAAEASEYNTEHAEEISAGTVQPVQEGDAKPADWKLAVADEALIQYVGGNGINVSAAVNGEKTISAVVKSGDKILSVDANGLQTTANITKITPTAYDAETGHQSGDFAARFGANVKEAYILTGINGQQIGSDSNAILIYKDASIISIDYITSYVDEESVTHKGQFLRYTYTNAQGSTETTYVDLSSIIVESEAGNGLAVADTAVDGKKALSVKIDSTTEQDGATTPAPFLSVSSAGVKVSGIKDEIAREIDAVGDADAAAGKMVIGVSIAHDGVTLDEAYIPTVSQGANTVNGSAPAAGTQQAQFSTVTISHSPSDEDDYEISHNIKTLPVANAVAPTYYTAEDDEVIAGTKNVGDLKAAGADGLVSAVDAKGYIDAQITAGTSFITNAEVESLFNGILSAGEISTIDALHTRS